MTDHVQTVQGIYEAFGRGDIPAILDRLAPDVAWDSWEDNYAQRAGVPHMTPRSGREGAAEFFRVVGEMEISDFQVLDLMASERQVVAEVRIVTSTFTDEELHLWTFGADGLVCRFRHYVDTAKHIAAMREATAV